MKNIAVFSTVVLILLSLSVRFSPAEDLPSIDKSICVQLQNPSVAFKYMNQHGAEIEKFDNQKLKSLSSANVFKYISGHTNPLNNFPAIYTSGTKEEMKISFVGCGFYKEFPISDYDDAVAAYKELLVLSKYIK
jgi:hypothetical protein